MCRILLVEDNLADISIFEDYLEGHLDFVLKSTQSLEEARTLVQSFSPDVVIVDLMLPLAQNETTIEMATQYFANEPILILTGSNDLQLVMKSLQKGVQDYLVKGEVRGDSLARSIRCAIERYRLMQENEHLKRIIRENEQLKRINTRMEQLAHLLSHDIRGPVARLMGLANLMEMHRQNPAECEVLTHQMKVTTTNLDQHLKDILSLLYEQDRWEKESSPRSWPALLSTTVALLNEEIQATQAEIVPRIEVSSIYYPPSVLKSILLNLLGNAIKYRSPDRQLRVKIGVSQITEGTQMLIVQDNGLGIDLSQYQDKLFMPFNRFHPHTEGKGIGLYLIRKIVEDLGGKISVESQVEAGTTFKFLLKETCRTGSRSEAEQPAVA